MKPWKWLFLFVVLSFACNDKEEKKDDTETSDLTEYQQPPVKGNSALPRLFSNGESLYLSWVEKKDTTNVLNYSRLDESGWSPAEEIISGDDWFVNWADFPVIAENNGNILTSFLQKSADGTYTYDVKLNLFSALENTWKKNFILHNDGTQSEHGFLSVRPYVDNSFFITWLDGRETTGGHGGQGAMTLRGAIVFEDGTIDYDTLLDDRVCDCCNTSSAIGPDSELIVAYRDRSEEEIRDISVVRWTAEEGWMESQSIGNDNWKIAGCPVNGPSLDSHGKSVALAWFTAAGEEAKVNVVFSRDLGASFGEVFRLDGGNATGRVELAMISEDKAAVVWMEPSEEDELLLLQLVGPEGKTGDLFEVAKTSSERASGFPQIEVLGDNLYLAWTVLEGDRTQIRTRVIPLNDL